MPLWGNTAAAATNKPKFLTDDANSDYDITRSYASSSGWMMRNSSATGNGNVDADDEVLVAIGGLAGTSTSTGLGRPTITRVRFGESSYTGAVAITVEVTWDEKLKYVAGDPASYNTASSQVTLTVTETAPVYEDSPHLTLVIVGRPSPVDVDVPARPPIATSISSSASALSLPVAELFLIIHPELEA